MRYVRVLGLLVGLLALAVSVGWGAGSDPVNVWEGEITIPSYPLYGSDINPKFYELEGRIVYPYSMQDHPSTTREDRTYRAVFLENEYLKVTCLPQIGGRIHSVLDKTTNEEMFYLNHVIKPGLIGLRGAWISGGVEWNRGPQGHTVTSFAPVNVITQKRPNGAAAIVIGYTERNFDTRWNVRLSLLPGKAYLDEEIRIFNPTDGVHSYYFWNNTAFPCRPGTRFIYPMTLGTDHGGTNFFSWPINDGRDLTWLKNYDAPTSVFAYHCAFDFFGAYDVDADRGIVQYGDHHVITGKKAWTWGQSGDGLASQAALTDEDGPYIEVQSGPLATQADYGLLEPRQEVAWQEWWYPVHGLGDGFEYATRDLAVQTYRKPAGPNASLEIRMLATSSFPNATCQVTRKGKTLFEQAVALTPNAPSVVTVDGTGTDPVEIAVTDASGNILAGYTSPLPIPVLKAPSEPETSSDAPDTAETAWLEGITNEERIKRTEARKAFERALEHDPVYTPALRSLAIMDLEAGLADKAAARLETALTRNEEDGLAWYYLGVARLRRNRLDEAVECGFHAVRLLDYAALGYDLVGRARMRMGDRTGAIDAFAQAVRLNPRDSRAKDHWLTALLADGQLDTMVAEIPQQYADDPLDLVLRSLVALQSADYLDEFVRDMHRITGSYQSEMIDLALYFDDLGLAEQGFAILDTAYQRPLTASHQVLHLGPAADMRERCLPWYVLAYMAHQAGHENKTVQYLQKAKTVYPHYAFVAQPKFIDVFDFAISADPQDGRAYLLLGNLYAGLGRLDDAVKAWERSATLPGANNVTFRNLGMYAWKVTHDLDKALALYQQAVPYFPQDQTLYRDMANILNEQQKPDKAITVLEKMPIYAPRRGDVIVLLADTYNDVARYDDALALLDGSTFSNWESNNQTWRVWSRAHLERGKAHLESGDPRPALNDFEAALTYPENLGVGRPAHPEEAEALYWKGKAFAALGKPDEARAAWTQGAAHPEGSANQKDFAKRCEDALKE